MTSRVDVFGIETCRADHWLELRTSKLGIKRLILEKEGLVDKINWRADLGLVKEGLADRIECTLFMVEFICHSICWTGFANEQIVREGVEGAISFGVSCLRFLFHLAEGLVQNHVYSFGRAEEDVQETAG